MSDKKSVRLNKLVKEFNVSIDRIYSFLESKGIEDLKPNTKVSYDIYIELLGEFDSEKKAKLSAELLAKEKALSISITKPNELIVGSDTIIIFKNKIINKTNTLEGAKKQLKKLSGNKHQIISAVSVCYKNKQIWSTQQTSTIQIKKLNTLQINCYL